MTRQVHTLKSALRESQDASDTMELEKAALEEAFKRTIKVKRNAKWMEEKRSPKFKAYLTTNLFDWSSRWRNCHLLLTGLSALRAKKQSLRLQKLTDEMSKEHHVESLFLIK